MGNEKTDSEKRGYGKRYDRKKAAKRVRREDDKRKARDEGVVSMSSVLAEAEWAGKYLDRRHAPMVGRVAQDLGWRIDQAAAFAVELLQDVNAHSEAKKVNDLLVKMGVFE